ncbi:uncharacterized protein K460DRAFT_121951 [Cucurbitaria berberidis CBS 394.84]|uniref:Uncharacterized protein n=1 Tax=Cucurbitaria berberidis CBS 394.84 TaxID=1168544 RepID=A0A9P4GIV7_9PLEO|nr:uncharacterized protein K460DRAFT_121951 [Cucurbitaria berberidis CBS 394.84]KAF1846226.1 hypothetical protein K460DRAFT_121951 [Cucurbitaria berberidis CBS 394.84]
MPFQPKRFRHLFVCLSRLTQRQYQPQLDAFERSPPPEPSMICQGLWPQDAPYRLDAQERPTTVPSVLVSHVSQRRRLRHSQPGVARLISPHQHARPFWFPKLHPSLLFASLLPQFCALKVSHAEHSSSSRRGHGHVPSPACHIALWLSARRLWSLVPELVSRHAKHCQTSRSVKLKHVPRSDTPSFETTSYIPR